MSPYRFSGARAISWETTPNRTPTEGTSYILLTKQAAIEHTPAERLEPGERALGLGQNRESEDILVNKVGCSQHLGMVLLKSFVY